MFSEAVYTPDEVAQHLKVPIDAVLEEITAGRLEAFPVGTHMRIRESALNAYKNEVGRAPEGKRVEAGSQLSAIPDFMHTWPDQKCETFTEAQEGIVEYQGRKYHAKIGFTVRHSAGKDRKRSLVLIDRYPTVEFVAGDTRKQGRMASIIKDREGKQIPAGATPPAEYAAQPLGSYRDVVEGPGASNGLAVICGSTDLQTMVKHALIRYQYRQQRPPKSAALRR